MRPETEAHLVGAASVMDLSGQTILRYSRELGYDDAEQHLALMALVRRGQTAMFSAVVFLLIAATVLITTGATVLGGAVAIFCTVFSFGISVWEMRRH